MHSGDFEKVTSVDALPEGAPVRFQLSDGSGVCLVRVGQQVFAFDNRCTHAEFPMSDGEMVDDYVIECGLHGAQFDVRTGKVLELPATEDLPCFPVNIRDSEVWVQARP
jgi:3-phenylpropionate/trans-cinnamate dioxygenase ferredoxin subunit